MNDYQLALWSRRLSNIAVALAPVSAVLTALAATESLPAKVRLYCGIAAGALGTFVAVILKDRQSAKDLQSPAIPKPPPKA